MSAPHNCKHDLLEQTCTICRPVPRPRGRPQRSSSLPEAPPDPRDAERTQRLRALAADDAGKALDPKKIRQIWTAALRVLKNEADADEVVAEIWRRYVSGKGRYEWLARDAKLYAKDLAKARQRRRQREDGVPGALRIDVWAADANEPMDPATSRIARL